MDEIDKIVVECTEIQEVKVETQTTTLRTNVDRSLLRDRLRLNSLLTLNLSAYTMYVLPLCSPTCMDQAAWRPGATVYIRDVYNGCTWVYYVTEPWSRLPYMEIILDGIQE